jgi:hypothetical protein
MILVQIHQRENLVDPFLCRVFVGGQLDHVSSHVVDRLNNLQHFVVRDQPIIVDVVQLESPYGHTRYERINVVS